MKTSLFTINSFINHRLLSVEHDKISRNGNKKTVTNKRHTRARMTQFYLFQIEINSAGVKNGET